MRFIGISATMVASLLVAMPAHAESGSVLKAGELKAQPFIDAATTDRVAANQPVTIVSRKVGWLQVQSNGKTGWLRMTNVRLAAGAAGAPRPANASLLRTGSSGRTVTTGVKGLGDEDIQNAVVNEAEVARLTSLALPSSEGTAYARQNGLQENRVDYLKAGKVK
jgi:hypothetical protein